MTVCLTPTFIMPEITELAEECSKRTQIPYMDWYDVLTATAEIATRSELDPDGFIMLTRTCNSPTQLLLIVEALNEHYKENPDGPQGFNMLLYYSEKSPYTLGAWLEAIEYFYDWLFEKQRHASLESLLKYVEAGLDMDSKKGAERELKEIVEAMLDQFSFQD